MTISLFFVLVGLGSFAVSWVAFSVHTSAAKESMPPVQVEVVTPKRAYSYDCWPVGERGRAIPAPEIGADTTMVVWLLYPNGVAGYGCEMVGRLKVVPILPPIQYEPISAEGGNKTPPVAVPVTGKGAYPLGAEPL